MVTLGEWLRADRDGRKRGLKECLQRIQELEPSIHAWVQVQPDSTGTNGPLAGIPFGAKDIIETKGMATEYGSPAYRGVWAQRMPRSSGSFETAGPSCSARLSRPRSRY